MIDGVGVGVDVGVGVGQVGKVFPHDVQYPLSFSHIFASSPVTKF